MHRNRTEASCVLGAESPPPLLKQKIKNLRKMMKWNGRGLTADSSQMHYVGVKEVANNEASTAKTTRSLRCLSQREGGREDRKRGAEEREGAFSCDICINNKPPTRLN